jgi:uncharacterized repeat protein (TIGR03803 family)
MNRTLGALTQIVWTTSFLAGCGGGSSSSPPPSPPPPPPSTTYTVGGNVAGLGATDSVTLQNNGGDTLLVNLNGGFTFTTRQDVGSAYAVTVQAHSPGIACSVGNGSGSGASSNVMSVSVSCVPGTLTILYSFGSATNDGMYPAAGLIKDSAGNFYGTTYAGGTVGVGTVFKISSNGTESVLHSFAGPPTDGGNPQASLVMDSTGNLYGTTSAGGPNNFGTVFKISTDGSESLLHAFAAGPTDGAYPGAGLIMDNIGNLYGTTSQGGQPGITGVAFGTVFKISADGTESIVHSFGGASQFDGGTPYAGLIMDVTGNFYGTTRDGTLDADTFGAVFKISADGTESIVHAFTGLDGGEPVAGLTMDNGGNLYGTTTSGGDASVINSGEVFKINSAGTLSVLHYFLGAITSGIADGGYPRAGLIMDNGGNLYGTTSSGGATDVNVGTVFKISATGAISFLHSFTGAPSDGNNPIADLILDSTGNLYGTTSIGGANDQGTVFKID